MGVVVVEPQLPMPGIPDRAVIEKAVRGMAGCAPCLGIGVLGENGYDPGEGGAYVDQLDSTGSGGGYVGSGEFLKDITRGTLSIVSSVFTPPSYKQATTPTGTLTEVRVPGYSPSYPGSSRTPQPQPSGISATTLLLIAGAALLLLRGR